MARVLLVVDPNVGASPADLVRVWTSAPPAADGAALGDGAGLPDGAALGDGAVAVEAVRGRVMLPGVLEVLVLPVAVNLASSALFELVRSWVAQARGPAAQDAEFEVVETTDDQGNRVVVVRPRRTVR